MCVSGYTDDFGEENRSSILIRGHERKNKNIPLVFCPPCGAAGILNRSSPRTLQVKEKNVQNRMFPNILITGVLH